MNGSIDHNSLATRGANSSVFSSVFRSAPLVMMMIIFALLGGRYLINPVHSAAVTGIGFTAPGGVTIARVGFGALPLSIAILAFISLRSARWRLAGLYMVLTVDGVVIAVRLLGFLLDHSAASAPLLIPEALLLALSMIAIRLESAAAQPDTSSTAK